TRSCGRRGRVYRSQISSTVARNDSSRGTFGLNQWCTRHGLSLCDSRIRCTDWGEISSTTPSRLSARASSSHVQSESERPSASGSSQASLTRCVATTGGKTAWTPASCEIFQAAEPLDLKTLTPLAHDPSLPPHLTREHREVLAGGQPQDHLRTNH